MFRTTLTVLFAALTLSVPAFAQKGATGQDATQSKPLAELKETESTYEEVPVVIGTGSTKTPAEDPAVLVLERRATNSDSGLSLALGLDEGILHADIHTKIPKFFGGVLLSLTPELMHIDDLGLLLLSDAAVMGMGFGLDGHLALKVPAAKDLAGLEFFGQAVVADGYRIFASDVVLAIAN